MRNVVDLCHRFPNESLCATRCGANYNSSVVQYYSLLHNRITLTMRDNIESRVLEISGGTTCVLYTQIHIVAHPARDCDEPDFKRNMTAQCRAMNAVELTETSSFPLYHVEQARSDLQLSSKNCRTEGLYFWRNSASVVLSSGKKKLLLSTKAENALFNIAHARNEIRFFWRDNRFQECVFRIKYTYKIMYLPAILVLLGPLF